MWTWLASESQLIGKIQRARIGYNLNGYTFWVDQGSTVTFTFQTPLPVSASKQYVWTGTSGLSPLRTGSFTVTGSGTVTGNYKSQHP